MDALSFEEAVCGFAFYDTGSRTLHNKLYASTEQFPICLYRFLQDAERQHFKCREIRVDTHSVDISDEAVDVAALFQAKTVLISAGMPQENALAESGVRVQLKFLAQ